jgi:hypothetical protein
VAKATRPGRRTELAPISEIKKVAEPIGQKNVAGDQVNPATEDTLSSVLAQLDITLSALRDALRGTGTRDFTTLETDLEAVLGQLDVLLSTRATEATLAALRDKLLNVYSQLIGADLTVAQSTTLDVDGRTLLEIHAASSAATDYTLEASADNTNFFTLATWAAVTAIDETWTIGWRYIRLSSAAAGVAGDTVTLVLSAGR